MNKDDESKRLCMRLIKRTSENLILVPNVTFTSAQTTAETKLRYPPLLSPHPPPKKKKEKNFFIRVIVLLADLISN